MKNKKVIILIILGIVAVLSIARGLSAPASSKRKAGAAAGPAASQHDVIRAAGQEFAVARKAVRTKFKSWGRNPFLPEGVAAPSESLSLGGIMWNEKNPKAMIGENIVKKGDRVGDKTVVEIRRDRVILNDGAKDIELILKE